MEKIILDKDILFDECIIKRRTVQDVAVKLGVSKATIERNLKKYNLSLKGNLLLDLHNQKVHNLLPIKIVKYTNHGAAVWECVCDCGNTTLVISSELVNGKRKSCGCVGRYKNSKHYNWQGYGEISRVYFGRIKHRAKTRDLEFGITIEYIWELFLFQNRKCALTGIELFFSKSVKDRNCTASLDRINSDFGYIMQNVQWVHKDINTIKLDYTQDEFIKLCCMVCDHYRSKRVGPE